MARIKKETESPIEELINEPVEEQGNELVTPAPQVIPDNIDRILKMYPGYEKPYIDSKGEAYTSQQPNAHANLCWQRSYQRIDIQPTSRNPDATQHKDRWRDPVIFR